MIQHGWPENKSTLPLLASPYFDTRDELSVQDGLIFKGERAVVPKAARSGLLKSIHNCNEYEQGQRKETLTSHEVPSRPWQFVAADLCELNGKKLPCDCGLF